jgi:hypothetical protein
VRLYTEIGSDAQSKLLLLLLLLLLILLLLLLTFFCDKLDCELPLLLPLEVEDVVQSDDDDVDCNVLRAPVPPHTTPFISPCPLLDVNFGVFVGEICSSSSRC